ncbi:hypothetical protein QPL79_05405 [Ignisphaera sp. 4213-co]|uniref:PIN domain-containing protein n=1 Tax=Ignisphaera cupida TaxID=3050454 RepID=A0ABD4Z6P3_9CREN|nr:hypothetical protein [Ignisphaera sp. 4213-co]MDK6028794.1 hypothetical protein [Ignisphaera sp. 4213-co]
MEESRIYDTSIIIDMVKRGSKTRVPHVSIITVVEYPPAITFAENILYPTRKD